MSAQPEVLRLADELDAYHTRSCHKEAAAELRRLHEENEGLKRRVETSAQALRQWLDKTEWIQDTAHGSELGLHRADAVRQRLEKAEAQRDALLEALQELCDTLGECGMTEKARAAIAKAEGEKE